MIRTNPIRVLRSIVAETQRQRDGVIRAPTRLHAAVNALIAKGVRLPRASLDELADRAGLVLRDWSDVPPEPGVVGLVVDEDHEGDDRGIIVPLKVEEGEWHVPRHLPFRVGDLQRLLLGLMEHATQARGSPVPEALRFAFHGDFERDTAGPSMHVAGLLAILDVKAGRPPMLRRACAVVQPRGDHLDPVEEIPAKLRAFLRECGRGTLLVYHPKSKADLSGFWEDFDRRWEVSSLADLARFAEGQGGGPDLLAPLLAKVELTADDLYGAHRFLRRLMKRHHHYARAYGLARRLLPHARERGVSRPLRREVERSHLDLSRNLGYVAESVELARALARDLAYLPTATCYDERAEADVVLAAALYHAHEFEEIGRVLGPWLERIRQSPLSLYPETRVKVQNTVARALIAQDADGWQCLLDASVELLDQRDPDDLPRTLCYRAHGHLRKGQLDEAEADLQRINARVGSVLFARGMRSFLLADLARRRGCDPFTNDEMEGMPTGEFSLPLASYLQATARHPRCPNPSERFGRAAAALRADAGEYSTGNLLHGLASLLDLAAAESPSAWNDARVRLCDFLVTSATPRLRDYYRDEFDAIGDAPDPVVVERLLTRVPHF